MANPNELKQLRHQGPPRNVFDMSYRTYQHSPMGLMLPTYHEHTIPDDYWKGNTKGFLRTAPVSSTPFSRMNQRIDTYYVPYRLVWKWWDRFYTGIVNDHTLLFPQNTQSNVNALPIKVPFITSDGLRRLLIALFPAVGDTSTNKPYKFDQHGYPLLFNVLRLLDLLGYGSASIKFNDGSATPNPALNTPKYYDYNYWIAFCTQYPDLNFNIIPLLSYQCINWHFFRNTKYPFKLSWTNITAGTQTVTFDDSQPYWNIDHDINGSISNYDSYPGGGPYIDIALVAWRLFKPCYCPYYKDRYTEFQPTVASNDAGLNLPYPQIYPNAAAGTTTIGLQGSGAQVNGNTGLSFNISTLRAAYALDEVARLKAMSKQTYAAQYEAYFGKTRNMGCTTPIFLGTYRADVVINEVVSQADTSNDDGTTGSPLGTIGGKVTASGDGSWKLEADEHGMIISVCYIQPESEYCSDRINDFNLKTTRNDFYTPQYDNLGLQPITGQHFGFCKTDKTLYNRLTSVFGFQARYSEYKSRVNEVHGEFQGNRSLSNWAIPRSIILSENLASPQNFYVNPNIMNTIFSVNYDGSHVVDPFYIHVLNDVKVSRNMSTLGVPSI